MADTFDYYADEDSFLSWALIAIIGKAREDGREDEDFFNELKKRSKNFSRVELSIKVNGLDVDATGFMKRLEKTMDLNIDQKASERLEGIREIAEVEDELVQLRDILKQRVNQLAKKYDIELYRED